MPWDPSLHYIAPGNNGDDDGDGDDAPGKNGDHNDHHHFPHSTYLGR